MFIVYSLCFYFDSVHNEMAKAHFFSGIGLYLVKLLHKTPIKLIETKERKRPILLSRKVCISMKCERWGMNHHTSSNTIRPDAETRVTCKQGYKHIRVFLRAYFSNSPDYCYIKLKLSHYTPRRLGGRADIAPAHSRPRHQMGWVVSVTPRQCFIPGERTPRLQTQRSRVRFPGTP
jgi:hypothetical protein